MAFMKSKGIWLIAIGVIAGCMASNGLQYEAASETNLYHIAKLRKGMNEKQVLQIMHKPYSYESFQVDDDVYDVWFYVTRTTGLDQTRMVPQNLTPLTFKNGVLVGTEYYWYYYAMKEEAAERAVHLPTPAPETKKPSIEDKEFEEVLKKTQQQAKPANQSPTPAPSKKENQNLPPNVHIISSNQACPSCGSPRTILVKEQGEEGIQTEAESQEPSASFAPCMKCLDKKYQSNRFVNLWKGMSEEQVFEEFGEPVRQECFTIGKDVYDVWFYETHESKTGKPSIIPQHLTAITFKNSVLISMDNKKFYQIKEKAETQFGSLSAPTEVVIQKEPEKPELDAPIEQKPRFQIFRPYAPLSAIQKEISKIKKGMTPEEVQQRLGEPTRVERAEMGEDSYEIWFYEKNPVVFKNGRFIGTQKEYQKIKPKDQINGYDRADERMQEDESEQNFNFW